MFFVSYYNNNNCGTYNKGYCRVCSHKYTNKNTRYVKSNCTNGLEVSLYSCSVLFKVMEASSPATADWTELSEALCDRTTSHSFS